MKISNLISHPLNMSRLPRSLTELILYSDFNQHLTNLPPSLTALTVSSFAYPFTVHHSALKRLYLHESSSLANLPYPQLRELTLGSINDAGLASINSDNFPNLEKLVAGFIQTTGIGHIDLSTLPSSLTRLEMNPHRNVVSLPSNVQSLSISCLMVEPDWSRLWSPDTSLHTLAIDNYSPSLNDGDIPLSVTYLELNNDGSIDFDNMTLPSINSLSLRGCSNEYLLNVLEQLPKTIGRLDFEVNYVPYNFRRITSTLFLNIRPNFGQSGFIRLDDIQSFIN
ncbi:hypothetical protein SAMD00019534_026340, partial [Acytostelium subglobosum LB1]|uniref:hypothetical protein n=1 Tax=Acytostelium subglobosum LB1 TaxID=1410327 RepID=UPI000644D985